MANLNEMDNRIKTIEDALMKVLNFDKNITVNAGEWASTDIKLAEGVYIFQIRVYSAGYGGGQYNEFYSGVISGFDAGTNSEQITEIPMSNCGHAPTNHFCVLGFKRVGGNTGLQEIVLSANESFTNCPINFKFRKVI